MAGPPTSATPDVGDPRLARPSARARQPPGCASPAPPPPLTPGHAWPSLRLAAGATWEAPARAAGPAPSGRGAGMGARADTALTSTSCSVSTDLNIYLPAVPLDQFHPRSSAYLQARPDRGGQLLDSITHTSTKLQGWISGGAGAAERACFGPTGVFVGAQLAGVAVRRLLPGVRRPAVSVGASSSMAFLLHELLIGADGVYAPPCCGRES